MRRAEHRLPLILLILGTAPPITVRGFGSSSIPDAIAHGLPKLAARGAVDDTAIPGLMANVDSVIAWTTWTELAACVVDAAGTFKAGSRSADGTIARLAGDLTNAVAWHT